MKTITKYECEKCHELYDTMEGAAKCEESHVVPVEIHLTSEYKPPMCEVGAGYPYHIQVRMSNGDVAEYVFDRTIFRVVDSKELE